MPCVCVCGKARQNRYSEVTVVEMEEREAWNVQHSRQWKAESFVLEVRRQRK